jgi:hypothetical protein
MFLGVLKGIRCWQALGLRSAFDGSMMAGHLEYVMLRNYTAYHISYVLNYYHTGQEIVLTQS